MPRAGARRMKNAPSISGIGKAGDPILPRTPSRWRFLQIRYLLRAANIWPSHLRRITKMAMVDPPTGCRRQCKIILGRVEATR